ncbi:MAG: TetR/AcrR family transcriptional regulator [Bacteroidales bacterium]|nr:TetR/AcrR family transcriptional regulator [Bacteroidales bacterium]
MTESPQNAEQLILQSARKVFIEKGMTGARMQEIADEAGINKALLHYYFRSKDQLFQSVFLEAFQKFMPQVELLISSELPFLQKLEIFVHNYIGIIIENPYLPGFVLHELSQNPQRLADLLSNRLNRIPDFLAQIQQEIQNGLLKPFDPRQILINTFALCIFPFVARPIMNAVVFQNDRTAYERFLEQRKTDVFNFIKSAILIEKP